MDDQVYKESAYTDLSTAIIMTAIMITLIVRYRKCQTDRLLVVMLWLHPISYYALTFGAMLVLIDEDKNKKMVDITQSIALPISLIIVRIGMVSFAFEMIFIKIKLVYDEYVKYANKERKWKIMRNIIVVLSIF